MSDFSSNARDWLISVLEERFGIEFSLQQSESDIKLLLPNAEAGQIVFPKVNPLFHVSCSNLPYAEWNAAEEGWATPLDDSLPAPGVAELSYPLIEISPKELQAKINYDILGLTYWMLNRIEEIGRTDLDSHGRFPAVHSHAFRHSYLERPVVDEWLNVLGQVMQRVWPQLQLKQHVFSMKVSHDVDSPSLYSFKSWGTIARMMAGHLLKRHDVKAFAQAPWIKLTARKQLHVQDPHNTFDWLMGLSEKHGLASAFYFICGGTSPLDTDYEPEHPLIQELMQRVHRRGHEIGLHPSYGTYQSPHLIKQEAERLRNACEQAGVSQHRFGGRMHYLRWEHPTTLQAWEDAGLAYDSTLGYADRPGFRCGTCYEYPAFNPVTQQTLSLRIRPLIAMECTIIAEHYMNLGYTQRALQRFSELKEKCRKVQGCFTLLWHNSHFEREDDFRMYKLILSR